MVNLTPSFSIDKVKDNTGLCKFLSIKLLMSVNKKMCLNFYKKVGAHVFTTQTAADKHTVMFHVLKV